MALHTEDDAVLFGNASSGATLFEESFLFFGGVVAGFFVTAPQAQVAALVQVASE